MVEHVDIVGDACVLCWHGNHKDKVCGAVDIFYDYDMEKQIEDSPCPCGLPGFGEYTSEEDRGKIIVKINTKIS